MQEKKIDKQDILSLLIRGYRPSKIAKHFGVSRQYIHLLFKKYDIQYSSQYLIKRVDDYFFVFRKKSNKAKEYIGFFHIDQATKIEQ